MILLSSFTNFVFLMTKDPQSLAESSPLAINCDFDCLGKVPDANHNDLWKEIGGFVESFEVWGKSGSQIL